MFCFIHFIATVAVFIQKGKISKSNLFLCIINATASVCCLLSLIKTNIQLQLAVLLNSTTVTSTYQTASVTLMK